MASKSVVLGSVCLDDFVSAPSDISSTEFERIDEEMKELGDARAVIKYPNGIERLPYEQIITRKGELSIRRKELELLEKYPELNLSFLSMAQKIEFEGETYQVPRFSVYGLANSTFGINIYSVDFKKKSVGVTLRETLKLFYSPLVKSLEFYSEPYSEDLHASQMRTFFDFINVPKNILEKYSRLGRRVLITEFNGMIPSETHAKIEEFKQFTNTEDIRVIKESKPEEWKAVYQTRDPLVVGAFKDRCYLIDHFNTTRIEDYVRREFSSK